MTPEPRVVALAVASAAGAPPQSVPEVRVVPGVGIPDDRYGRHEGTWERFPDRELTLVEAEAADAAGVAPAVLLRRNVVTRDVDLNALVGKRFAIGLVEVEGVRPCDPCGYLEKLLARPGLKAALEGRGGLRCRILTAGSLRVGDPVTVPGPTGNDA